MKHDEAKRLIQDTFEHPFDKTRYSRFASELFNALDLTPTTRQAGKMLPDAYKESVKSMERIGKYIDPEGMSIDVLAVKLANPNTIWNARTMQRNFVSRYLNGSRGGQLKDAAIVAFYAEGCDEWRFSFIRMEYAFDEEKKKITQDFTPARRSSYIVGPSEKSHTAQVQLLPILEEEKVNPLLAQLEKAFSVEKVTKRFFEQYKDLFFWLKESLDESVSTDKKISKDFKEKDVDTADFSKKLLGQVVFLYYLQKKGWFGVQRGKNWGSGSKHFLRELFEKKHGDYNNFFNDILEPLFYEALRLERPKDYYDKFHCRIPFLNGGLFDPLNDYDWQDTDITLPNDIFSNDRKTKEGDKGNGILDIFDRYNFTVKEDEPLEKEVAVDPEMLGKVFENLLEVKDRKSRGTYYTPREIVHYMCQESLANYLVTECDVKVTKEDIETLIKYGEIAIEHDSRVMHEGQETKTYAFKLPESVRKHAKLIDEKLASIRVCDPAVGSGAFPVGMMNEIIRTRNALTPHIGENGGRSPYNFKRHAIQNCLYGVDIDPGAVEIAKLRLWLSLIVDEEERETIQPLPNLDYKIRQGNSLLGIEKESMGMSNMFYEQMMKELHETKQLYFNETSANKKEKYRKRIDELISEITSGHTEFDFEVYFSEVFHEKKGFDVVIANPPYVGESGNKEIFRPIAKGNLARFYQGKMDLFYFFFHLALDIGKGNSKCAFISTNYFLTAFGAKKLRRDLKNRSTINNLVNFNELKIFESALGQHNMITIFSKRKKPDEKALTALTKRTGVASDKMLSDIVGRSDEKTSYGEVVQEDLYDGEECYIRILGTNNEDNPIQGILNKIQKENDLLCALCHINQGVVSGCDYVSGRNVDKLKRKEGIEKNDGIFVFDLKNSRDVEALKLFSSEEKKLLRPFFKNSDINRYWCETKESKLLLYLGKNHPDISSYPNVEKHLNRFRAILDDRREVQNGRIKYHQLQWYRTEDIFIEKKIVVPYRTTRNTFAINSQEWFCRSDCYLITENTGECDLKYILALLNSSLYFLWLYHKGKRKGETLELFQVPLSEIPIKKISTEAQKPFIDIVDKILTITKDDDYLEDPIKQAKVRDYEKQIDQLVYKLYGLTPEEIEIVEGSAKS